MGTDPHRHPVTSQWQTILNAMPIPARRDQHEIHDRIPIRIRLVWEHDGEEHQDAHARGWSLRPDPTTGRRSVWVLLGTEPRSAVGSLWLDPQDVERTQT